MLKVIFETSHLKSVFLGYFSLIYGFIFFMWVYFSRDFFLAKPTEYGPNEQSELSSNEQSAIWSSYTSKASSACERANRSVLKPSKPSNARKASTGQFRSLWAKRAPRVSEPSAVYTNQENQANQACSVRTKWASPVSDPSTVFANQPKLRKPQGAWQPSKPSRQASQANDQTSTPS